MKAFTHIKCLCTFWKPSVSRRMTGYFIILGLVVFMLTGALFLAAEKKSFAASAQKLIQHQLSRMADSGEADFLWRGLDRPQEELYDFSNMVTRFSSTFHRISDVSVSVTVSSEDEIGALLRSFNQMVDGLRDRDRIKALAFELEKGRQIQREFLPGTIPQPANWEISAAFYPAMQVSGDFYDVFTLPGGFYGLVIADVCDKGVGSALYMALFRTLIRVFSEQLLTGQITPENETLHDVGGRRVGSGPAAAEQVRSLGAVLYTNDYIARIHGDEGMFATLFFGVLNPSTGRLCYINAGHEPLFMLSADGLKTALKPTGPAVGLMPGSRFASEEIQMDIGDILIGYTDGVTEARSPEDELFTRHRLQSHLARPFASASELLEQIKSILFSFVREAPQSDDVTLLAVQRLSAAPIPS